MKTSGYRMGSNEGGPGVMASGKMKQGDLRNHFLATGAPQVELRYAAAIPVPQHPGIFLSGPCYQNIASISEPCFAVTELSCACKLYAFMHFEF